MKRRIALTALLLCASAARTAAGAEEPDPVEAVLGALTTEAAITGFVGVEPSSCVAASDTTRLCQWLLRDRNPGWQPLAQAIDTRARVGLLCELPSREGSDAARAPGSCSAHPRASNRGQYRVRGRFQEKKRAIAENQERAQAELDAALTLVELSRLIGAVPESCEETAPGQQLCVWRTTKHTWGHGTVAASVRGSLARKVLLRCQLPTDGGERAPGSCSAGEES